MADVSSTENPAALRELVARALAEDLGSGDVTAAAVVPLGTRAEASLIQKQPGVIYGLDAAREAFAQVGAESFDARVPEGEWGEVVPSTVAGVSGPARALLAAERVALNLLARLSGIATLTAHYVKAVEGTGVEILDTRKTTPGLRALEKAAVAAAGGRNHRMGLYDALLVKENHVALAGGVGPAVARAREAGEAAVEVECRTLSEVSEAVAAGADRILLDNMDPKTMDSAVVLTRGGEGATTLEASGGVTLENVRRIAETGVDSISVGALTHSAPALDVSMLLKPT